MAVWARPGKDAAFVQGIGWGEGLNVAGKLGILETITAGIALPPLQT